MSSSVKFCQLARLAASQLVAVRQLTGNDIFVILFHFPPISLHFFSLLQPKLIVKTQPYLQLNATRVEVRQSTHSKPTDPTHPAQTFHLLLDKLGN